MKKVAWSIVPATLLALALSSTAEAAIITFDFGSTSQTGLTVFTETEGGVTLTVNRETGSSFDISNIAGSQMLSPFSNINGGAFIANFSTLISSFSITGGDFTPSDPDTLLIQAFSGPSGTGTLLATFSQACCELGGGFVSITGGVTAANIGSVRFIGGSPSFPNSLFFDNIVVDTGTTRVPEPASMLLLGTGLLGAGVRRWRQKRA